MTTVVGFAFQKSFTFFNKLNKLFLHLLLISLFPSKPLPNKSDNAPRVSNNCSRRERENVVAFW